MTEEQKDKKPKNLSPRTPIKRMGADRLVSEGPNGPGRYRKTYLKEGRRFVGWICEPSGKGAGYKYQLIGRRFASSKSYATLKEAKQALAEEL